MIFKKESQVPAPQPGNPTNPAPIQQPLPVQQKPVVPQIPAQNKPSSMQDQINQTGSETLTQIIQTVDPDLINNFSTLQSDITRLKTEKNQHQSLFDTSKSNSIMTNFAPKTFSGSPCDFIVNLTELKQFSSLQELEQNYNNYIQDFPALLEKYQEMIKLMDGLRTKLNQSANAGQYTAWNAQVDSAKADFNNNIVSLQTEQMNVVRQNQPYLTPVNGRTVLDCYEEILDTMTELCENVYQPLQKSFNTIGIGPAGTYAKQLITGYQDIVRIYVQELGPMYEQILSQQQNTDQKRVQLILNQITQIIPQSYMIQITGIKAGLFELVTKNDPARLKQALHI